MWANCERRMEVSRTVEVRVRTKRREAVPVPYAAVRDRGLDGLGMVAVAAILVGIRMLDGTSIGSTWAGSTCGRAG